MFQKHMTTSRDDGLLILKLITKDIGTLIGISNFGLIYSPYILELEQNPLPSDCLYRLDLLLMKMKDMRGGQEMKEKMEVDQRKDKKLRDDYKKKKR